MKTMTRESANKLVFINCTYDTFTPANSGAICTWIMEQCKLAEREGLSPMVISRSSPHPQYERPNTVFIDYPHFPDNRIARKLITYQQQIAQWQHPRHKPYCQRIARAIREAGMERGCLVLSNDPELAVFMREWFPDAFILHHAQNANTTTPRFRRRFAASVDVATACSDYAARWNEDYFGLPANSITTLYNAANLEAFSPRQDWSVEKPLINFVGKTDPIKGPDILLKAACRLAKRTTAFRLQIVGRKFYDREAADDYQTLLKSLGDELAKAGVDVHFTGWVDRNNLPQVLGRAHIHVVPSRWDEPSALTIYEGMACGMATIGSRTGGTPEIISNSGLLFDRDNDQQLADHLEGLLLDRNECRALGEKARRRAEELSWTRTWKLLKSLLPQERRAGAVDSLTHAVAT